MHRIGDDILQALIERQDTITGIAYVPFFPLGGGFSQLQSSTLSDLTRRLRATPAQIAIAWLLRRAPNILLPPA
jgi:diketogulonate reductase-like aldo/keto reductase